MEILRTTDELRKFRAAVLQKVGFVPTMGALHAGHISLIKRCKDENEITIVSTFVNPTQFLAGEDLDKYPKNEAADIKICENLEVDVIFIPKADEFYEDDEPKISAPKSLSAILEGATRPGHFDGVLQVLNKLFNLTKPKNVYMGKKDAQQLTIVRNMVQNFFMDINVNACEIVRENDGLALSSRNIYLDEEQKMLALKLSRSLLKAKNLVDASETDINVIKTAMLKILEPLKVDYIAFVDRNFKEISKIEVGNSIILVAAYVDKTRLIDNIWL